MRSARFGLLALAGLVAGQTPVGFKPEVSAHLGVKFGSKEVDVPGTAMTKAETAKVPTISTKEHLDGSYTLIVFDISVPAAMPPGNPNPRRTGLHAMISGYTSAASPDSAGVYVLKTADESKPAAYMGPAPPAENPPYAHNYVELLFAEPSGWKPPASVGNRFGITDRAKFIEGLKFGADPVAANYFNVTG